MRRHTITRMPEAEEIAKLKLEQVRAYIAGQANVFDATDTKTGAALGFAFIAIFQILAGILRAPPTIFHRTCVLSCMQWSAFGFLVLSFITALFASAKSRWPRVFGNHADLTGSPTTHLVALTEMISELEKVAAGNANTLEEKRHWAQITYFAVGAAILSSFLLAAVLFIAVAAFPAP
jgi:hypothetical protein